MVDEQSRDLIENSASETAAKSEIRKLVEEYLGKRYEVLLKDGRLVRGLLIATDKDANMIFHSAEESWSQNKAKGSRHLGQAMISKKHVRAMYGLPDPMPRQVPVIQKTESVTDAKLPEQAGAAEPTSEASK